MQVADNYDLNVIIELLTKEDIENLTFEIGGNIKKLREFRGYTQEYMAQELNISQKTYSNIESDRGKVNKSQIEHIATVRKLACSIRITPIPITQLRNLRESYMKNVLLI